MVNEQPRRSAWLIVALLFGFMVINFADKVIVGLAGVPMMKELGLTPRQFGLVGSSFFFLFSLSAVLVGFAANRINTKWLLLGMGLVWAIAQFPMTGVVSLPLLVACRVVLGAGEGPAYPVALHAAYKWFPNAERTLPTAIIAQGAPIGVVLAVPALEWVIEHFTWHAAFGVLGVVGLLWVVAWWVLGEEGTTENVPEHAPVISDSVPYRRLLLNPTTLAGFAAGFGAFWGQALLLAWFTPFLVSGLGYRGSQAAWITAIPWALNPIVAVSAGLISQRLVMRGASTRAARGILGSICVCLGGVAMLSVQYMPSNTLKIAAITLGFVLPAVIYIMGHAMVSEFTPPHQRGAMIGINNAVATSAGIIAPFAMGNVIQGMGAGAAGYEQGYAIAGAVCLAGGLLGVMFLRPERERDRLRKLAAVTTKLPRLQPATS
jgi:MFS transporter, ACS family, D-galactonate transporter